MPEKRQILTDVIAGKQTGSLENREAQILFHRILTVFAMAALGLTLAVAPQLQAEAQSPSQDKAAIKQGDVSAAGGQNDPLAGIDREALGIFMRDYIMSHPDIIVEAVQKFQQEGQVRAEETSKVDVAAHLDELQAVDDLTPFVGPADAKTVVVEFFDYQCGFCSKMLPTIQKLISSNPDVKVIFREYPILSERSFDIARAALAAQKQGKYFEFHNAMMSKRGSKDMGTIMRVARRLGMDDEQLAKDMEGEDIYNALVYNFELARKLNVNGTPATAVNDRIISGAVEYERLAAAIEDAQRNSLSSE